MIETREEWESALPDDITHIVKCDVEDIPRPTRKEIRHVLAHLDELRNRKGGTLFLAFACDPSGRVPGVGFGKTLAVARAAAWVNVFSRNNDLDVAKDDVPLEIPEGWHFVLLDPNRRDFDADMTRRSPASSTIKPKEEVK